MKKSLLFYTSMFVIGTASCGQPEAPAHDVPDVVHSSADRLTLRNCSALPIATVRASGNDGTVPANTVDDRLDTRWSNLGKGSWLEFDLGADRLVAGAAIAWHSGNTRTSAFTLSTSSDGVTYTQVYSGQSTGLTTAAETYSVPVRTARRLRITVNGNNTNDWASIAEARVCVGATTTSSVVWRGDFETGDRSQWSGTQMVSSDRLAVLGTPTRESRYALKATVQQGDDPINSSGNRNELVRETYEPVGSEYFYRWSTMFAPDFPSVSTWQLFVQWHHTGSSGSPPLEFYVYGEEIRLNIGGSPGTIVWRTKLVRGVWNDFILRVKWSPDPTVGFVELYHNGVLALPRRTIATQFSGQLNYLKVGLYRNETIAQTGVVYHDGWTMARRLEDVLTPNPLTGAAAVAAEAR